LFPPSPVLLRCLFGTPGKDEPGTDSGYTTSLFSAKLLYFAFSSPGYSSKLFVAGVDSRIVDHQPVCEDRLEGC
jgi:hypothetical protein